MSWAVTEAASITVNLFDHDLRHMARFAVPLDDPQMNVRANGQLVAAGDKHQIVVLDHNGAVQWRSDWHRLGAAAGVDFDLDGDHILWVRLAGTKELVAIHATTGKEIHRTPLPGPEAAWFVHRPVDTWTGLALLHPDPSPAMLIGLDAEHIVLRPLVGHDLAGFSPAGHRYLTMALDGFLSVRDVTTDIVIAERHLEDLPNTPPGLACWRYLDRAVFLTDELILIAVSTADLPDDAEEHLLLSACSLRCRSQMRYPHPHRSGSIYPAQQPSRWLTRHHEEDLLRLWQLDGRLDDEPLPGQIALL
ncbi:hypothetical protein AB0F73_04475 [Micromonospora purpureochromogenes]|uniref:hypothetical protein n=1 Tax=Micromonospora purpureochromogenes TaxID=47872 RepID=UPI0033E7206A